MPVQYDNMENVLRLAVAWSPDDSQLIYGRNPRTAMCGEDDGRRVGGNVGVVVSNIDLTDDGIVNNPIDKDGVLCDEVAIHTGILPDWWRGVLCGNGVKAGIEQCDEGDLNGDPSVSCSTECKVVQP